jgi:hypothetical protein
MRQKMGARSGEEPCVDGCLSERTTYEKKFSENRAMEPSLGHVDKLRRASSIRFASLAA